MTTDPNTQRRALGRRIRAWRLRRGLSQADLAEAIGVTQSSLSNYENAKRDLPASILIRIAEELEVELSDLAGHVTPARRRNGPQR